MPLTPHNSGSSCPFWACFQKKDFISVVLNTGYILTSQEEFGEITIQPPRRGWCVPLVRSGVPPSAFSESSPGAATVEKSPYLKGLQSSLPLGGGQYSLQEGPQDRTRCLFRQRVPPAEDSQAKTTFSRMKLETRTLLIKDPLQKGCPWFYEFLGDPPVSKVRGLGVISCHPKEQINSIRVTPCLSVSKADINNRSQHPLLPARPSQVV